MKKFEVVVIGSGPAGALSALKLAESGISVTVVEKKKLPRYKTCGGGLVLRGRNRIPFDVSEAVEREFFKVDIYFHKMGVHLTSEREEPTISMVMRDTFDHLLMEKAKNAGVTLLQEHTLENISFGEKITLHTSQGDIETQFVIAADGALSKTAKLTGWKETRYLIPALEYEVEVTPEVFERFAEEVRFDFDIVPYGYAWSFPKKNHLSLGLASARRNKLSLKKYYVEYLEKLGIGEKDIVSEKFHGFQIPVTPRTDCYTQKNVFLVGDAAGFADPITAEGISNAISSGMMAAEAIVESKLDGEKAMVLYENRLQENLIPELKTGMFLSKLFYDHAKVRNFAIKKYGQRACEAMTDLFTGKRNYPVDIKKKVKAKLKEALIPVKF